MAAQYLSRHFISERADALVSIPFAPPASDGTGGFLAHNILAMGAWNEDAQGHRLTICDIAVRYNGTQASTPVVNRLASFQNPGVTSLAAVDMGDGAVLIVSGSVDGYLSRLRLRVPTVPGSSPNNIQIKGEDLQDAMIPTSLQPHESAVTSIDIHPESKTTLSVSMGGSIALSSLEGSCSSNTLYDSQGSLAFTSAKWASSNALYTTSLQGAIHGWDARQSGKPTLTLQSSGSPPALALAVNPAQPFICAAGYGDGTIKVWDTRNSTTTESLALSVNGNPTGIQFISGDGFSSTHRQAQLAYSTSRGAIGTVDLASGAVSELYHEPSASALSMTNNMAGAVNQIFVSTNQEGLIFIANAL